MSKRAKLILELAKNAISKTSTNVCKLPSLTEDGVLIEKSDTFSVGLGSGNSTKFSAVISVDQENSNKMRDDNNIGLHMEESEQNTDLGIIATYFDPITSYNNSPVNIRVEDALSAANINNVDIGGVSSSETLFSPAEEALETVPSMNAEIQTESDSSTSFAEYETIAKEPALTKA